MNRMGGKTGKAAAERCSSMPKLCKSICLASAIWLTAAAPGFAAAERVSGDAHVALLTRVIDQHVVPRLEALELASGKLAPAVVQVCATGSTEARDKLREAFRDTAAALAAVDFYRFGPLAEQGRREKLAFWPDPRGTTARQLRQLTAALDASVLEPGAIARQSAALQGLPALELLITGDTVPLGTDAEAQYRCRLAEAIAGNVAALSLNVHQGWTAPDGMRSKMLSAGPDNPIYKTHAEAAAEFVKSLLTGLQVVAEQQLKPRLAGKGPGTKGPYGKLGLERDVYAGAVSSLRDLYGLIDFEANLARDKAWMKNWAKGTWRAIAMSDGMGGPGAGTPQADAPQLKEVVSRIGGIRMLIGREMANASGIAIGFNELDGD